MSEVTTPAIYLCKDLKQADEQAQLRAALRGWLAARDIQSSDSSGPTIHEQEVAALKHLETVARRLEGM